MLGVHGNGLTHLLWMPPTPRSAVIEMFFVGGFARDCESFGCVTHHPDLYSFHLFCIVSQTNGQLRL